MDDQATAALLREAQAGDRASRTRWVQAMKRVDAGDPLVQAEDRFLEMAAAAMWELEVVLQTGRPATTETLRSGEVVDATAPWDEEDVLLVLARCILRVTSGQAGLAWTPVGLVMVERKMEKMASGTGPILTVPYPARQLWAVVVMVAPMEDGRLAAFARATDASWSRRMGRTEPDGTVLVGTWTDYPPDEADMAMLRVTAETVVRTWNPVVVAERPVELAPMESFSVEIQLPHGRRWPWPPQGLLRAVQRMACEPGSDVDPMARLRSARLVQADVALEWARSWGLR